MTGYGIDELIGQSPQVLYGRDTDEDELGACQRSCESGEPCETTTYFYRKDGTSYTVHWRLCPIRDASGEITHFISTQRDITERYLHQREVEHNEAFLLQVGELARIGGWRYDKRAGKMYCSRELKRLIGADPDDEISFERGLEIWSDEAEEKILAALEQCLQNGTTFDLVLPYTDYNGVDKWARSKGEPLIEDGSIIGAWGAFQDVTELYELKQQNETFLDLGADLYLVGTPEGMLLDAGKRWEAVCGYRPDELIGNRFDKFVHPDDLEAAMDALKQANEEGNVSTFACRTIHKDGSTLHFSFSGVRGPNRKRVYFLAQNLTPLKEKEAELEAALTEARMANQSKNQFLMVMSHEMRTPLNPILGCADLLYEQVDESQKELINLIRESAIHLTSLINDILDISSIEAGRASVSRVPFDIIRTLKSSANLMHPKAVERGLHLEFRGNGWSEAETPLFCIGDERKVRQIVLNLINNALKFTLEGTIVLEFLEPVVDDQIAEIVFKVSDTGIGIPEDELRSIFNRFYQVSMTKAREYQGQGLGLALCRELAQLMDGRIDVESEVGVGSTFTVTIPMELLDDAVKTKRGGSGKTAGDGETDDRPLHALIAEDDPVNQLVLKRLLDRLKVTSSTAVNGAEAVELARSEAFDFILMDIQMPELDGIEATAMIRQAGIENSEIPIIAISAHAIEEVRVSALDAGMDNFIEKPVNLGSLSKIVSKVRNGDYFKAR